jgi:predicted molibdopterin-dependent oxidoreductase YjgC
MAELTITIDGRIVSCTEGMSVLEAAAAAEIYIPRLCHNPDLPCARVVILAESVHHGYIVLSG